ncbi:MAG: hypothetical protein HRU38_14685 [Saccharospirillaceae bacterium]|nr:hypothetical protein [Pseudomonadales bacterium]NRB79888.1 hypothetical protein [Saccharospirillaceae bacterium]
MTSILANTSSPTSIGANLTSKLNSNDEMDINENKKINTINNTVEFSSSTVELSSRSQNIQKLNEEFFSGGIQGFQVSNAFIDRLAQYGLISNTQADDLASTIIESDTDSTADNSLNASVKSLIENIAQQDPDNGLIEPLQKTLEMMSRIDNDINKPTSKEITEIKNEIKLQQSTNATDNLIQSDIDTLHQLNTMLNIAEKLTPSTLNSTAINSYLEHVS